MTIVGPRPERPEIAEEYEKVMPEFRLRLQAKAGLTGYAQVYGKYNTTPYDKLLMDALDYGVLGTVHSAVKISSVFRIIEYAKSGTNFLFMALAFGFFAAHLKQRSYLSNMEK